MWLDLIEWYISGDSGGKDGQGVAVRYDSGKDVLVPDSDFRMRVKAWKSLGKDDDSDQLKVRPDEATLRAYLNGQAFFHTELGMLIMDDDLSYLQLEQELGI